MKKNVYPVYVIHLCVVLFFVVGIFHARAECPMVYALLAYAACMAGYAIWLLHRVARLHRAIHKLSLN